MLPAPKLPVRLLRIGLQAAALALIALYVVTFALKNIHLQWDFNSYRLAGLAALRGLDPYHLASLEAVAHKSVKIPFIYPPASLAFFLPFAALPIGVAAATWIALKCAILFTLVFVWARWFVPKADVLAVALLAVFGWNSAALWDLRSGNVALIECLLLWSAFKCLVDGHRAWFAALIVAASIFKLTPAAYLLLLLVPSSREKSGSVPGSTAAAPATSALPWVSMAALALVVVLPLAIGPASHWHGFLLNVPNADALGESNPSSFALSVLMEGLLGGSGAGIASGAFWLWAAYALLLIAASFPFLRDAWRARDPMRCVMAAVFLDVLLSPRPMAYGFLRLGPAPLYLAGHLLPRPGFVLLLALIFSAQGLARAAHHSLDSTWAVFFPLLSTLGLWLLVVASHAASARAGIQRAPADRAAA